MNGEMTATYYAENLATEEGANRANLSAYLAQAISSVLSHHFGTQRPSQQDFRYEDSIQVPFVQGEDINCLQETVGLMGVSQNNLRAIEFLDKWFAEPDDLGEQFWKEFDKELEANRFSIS